MSLLSTSLLTVFSAVAVHGAVADSTNRHTTSSPSPISLNVNFSDFLKRSNPVWHWTTGSHAGPTQWVDSLFGGNGDHGFQLWAPQDGLLQLDVSKMTLWDDRTPDLGYASVHHGFCLSSSTVAASLLFDFKYIVFFFCAVHLITLGISSKISRVCRQARL